MALGKPINELILPQYREKWDTELHKQWFVRDENDIDQCRTPGM